jgi:hypothetical protein
MIKYHNSGRNEMTAEITDASFKINLTQDAIDLIAETSSNNCNRIIIREANLHKDFFNLKTGLAGDILQKFSNYGVRLAIIGDFDKYNSKSLRDFIRECNRGKLIYFTDNHASAISRLSVK